MPYADTPETLGRRPARMAGTRVRAGQRLGPLGGLYAGTAGGGALRLRVPHDPRARHAAHRQAHQSNVGRRSVQPRRAEPFVQRRQRRRAGDRPAGGFRRAVRSPDDRDATGRGLYRRGGIPLYQCRALCGFPNRFGASRMAEQADQGAQADRAGHCGADLRHTDRFDPDRQVARQSVGRSGSVGGDHHADFPRQHSGIRLRHPAFGQRHAQGGGLDFGSQIRGRRLGDRGVAHDGESPQFRQYDRYAAALPAGERFVPELARHAGVGRPPREALGEYRHDQRAVLYA